MIIWVGIDLPELIRLKLFLPNNGRKNREMSGLICLN